MACLLVAWGFVACGAPARAESKVFVSRGSALEFAFHAPDGANFTSQGTRGRVTLVLFITTFDVASQLSSQQGNELFHTFTPRINVGAVIMEAAQYEALKQTYQETLELSYPVVMADYATLAGRGPFGDVAHIPTLVVLDARGREAARLDGPVSMSVLEEALRRAQR